jgi:hypothetical protein
VDTVEAPNGIVCSGGMAADDPLCTEQFGSSAVASLNVVPEPGYGFTGWTVNGAEITLTSADPLFLTTMPVLAANGEILMPVESPAECQPNCTLLEIISPQAGAVYHMSEENYTTTPKISFKARAIESGTAWQGEIEWMIDLEYDTTKSRGKWTRQDTFSTTNESVHEKQYRSEGGKVTAVASVMLSNGKTLTKRVEFMIVGVDIPDNIITSQLTDSYTGATSNLLTGVAAVETAGDYDQFRVFSKYGVTDLWPNESKSDNGSHIGLMQVAIRETGETSIKARIGAVWNWLTNIQTAIEKHWNPTLAWSHQKVEALRAEYQELPDLTDVQHENNVLSMYRIGWAYPKCFYYVPNVTFTNWTTNVTNSTGVNYANEVRSNLR